LIIHFLARLNQMLEESGVGRVVIVAMPLSSTAAAPTGLVMWT
jgi:hypothetical protein